MRTAFQDRPLARAVAALLFVVLLPFCAAQAQPQASDQSQTQAQDRADCRDFQSSVLRSIVRYCVYLPPSFSLPASKSRKYPVLYVLHGLGGTHQTMVFDGEWNEVQNLRRDKKVGEFVMVTPEAWDTFYINSRDRTTLYGDFFLHEFMPFVERKYRILGTRRARGITGFSMGGYGALRTAFGHPELFASVSAHSAAIMRERPRDLNTAAPAGNMAEEVLGKVFGLPIDENFWNLNSPYVLARKNAAAFAGMKIYFDCGTEDGYGFYRGASELDALLKSLKIPHEFHLYPGAHNTRYLLAHSDATFEFHWRVFSSAQ